MARDGRSLCDSLCSICHAVVVITLPTRLVPAMEDYLRHLSDLASSSFTHCQCYSLLPSSAPRPDSGLDVSSSSLSPPSLRPPVHEPPSGQPECVRGGRSSYSARRPAAAPRSSGRAPGHA